MNELVKYIPSHDWSQSSSDSILTGDGRYDYSRFSESEANTVISVLNTVVEKYPREYRAIGLANESESVLYKARGVLFKIITELYKDSDKPEDNLAVAFAYMKMGAAHRNNAIKHFESCEGWIDEKILYMFLNFLPLGVYSSFSKVYEQEKNYKKAIQLTLVAKRYGDESNTNFDLRILELKKKSESAVSKKSRKAKPDEKYEESIEKAAWFFIKNVRWCNNDA